MANSLIHTRCLMHGEREAVAKCPECSQFYCRECISEQDGRLVCSTCLKKTTAVRGNKKSRLGGLLIPIYFLFGALVVTLFFYEIGQILIKIPSSFHDGTVWGKRGMFE